MTSPRSLHLPACTLARLISQRSIPAITASALLVFVISGCGINITPPQADSSTADTADDPGEAPGMPMASAGGNTGMQAAMPGMEASADPSANMAGAMHGAPDVSSADDSTANMEAAMAETMHGDPGVDPSVDGQPSEEEMRQMMEENLAAEAEAGAGGALDPEQMEEMMERQLAGRDPGERNQDAGAEGFDEEGGGRSGGRANQFDEGHPAHTVMLMVEAIDAGDMETAANYIGDDADGLLGSVRDGDAGQNQLSQLQSYFATMDPIRARPSGRSITLTFNGGQNKVLSFVVAKEGRDFIVDSLTIREAQDRRGR